jgi:hypothetical protein
VSIHLLEQAALLKLPPSHKLAFMAFCDSADKETGVAYPGFDQVMAWSGVGRSRCHEIIADLINDGYLERLTSGHRGRRAEFRVFVKLACCALHEPFGRPELSAVPDPIKGSAVPDGSGQSGIQTGDWVRKGSGKGPAAHAQTEQPPYSLTTTTPPNGGVAAELPLDGSARPIVRPMSLNKRAQELAKAYAELVPLSRFPAVMGIVKQALNAKSRDDQPLYSDDQIRAALVRLAEEGRPVTVDTLRIEIEGLTAARVATYGRRAGGTQPSNERIQANMSGLAALARREGHA